MIVALRWIPAMRGPAPPVTIPPDLVFWSGLGFCGALFALTLWMLLRDRP